MKTNPANDPPRRALLPDEKSLRRWQERSSRPAAWITATLIGFALVFTALTLIMPKRDFSDRENRKLADPPKLSLSALADGSFAEDTQSWFSDHFFSREDWNLYCRYIKAYQ